MHTHLLKQKLYKLGFKKRLCEECGQGEEWRGKKMSLILDHINGVNNDNRIENLRIICPNCNATLDTHCGKNRKPKKNSTKLVVKEQKYGEEIIEMVIKNGYVKTGVIYNVSDNAIRKWVKKLGYDPKTLKRDVIP